VTRAPFKDNPALRQALSMAIDREVLTEKVIGRGEQPAYSWVPPGVNNDENNPLEVEIRYNTSDIHQRIAVAIQSMWRETLGFEAKLINEEFQVLLANMRNREITQVFRSSWTGDYNDAHTFLQLLQGGNPSNMSGYVSEEYDSLFTSRKRSACCWQTTRSSPSTSMSASTWSSRAFAAGETMCWITITVST
jgi:ABC-type oligopeptide transport system substrate-binding subunit